jgi:energy-coupling factor transporter transmembrane protein EcfT
MLRAFWIAMVGLRAVFPQGIDFDKIPNTSKELAEEYKNSFISLDTFIVRLDKICSQIFSIAFLLVLFSIMMAMTYSFAFIGTIGLKTYFPQFFAIVKPIFLVLFIGLMIFTFLITYLTSKPQYREIPLVAKLSKHYIQKSKWLFLGLYKPMQYINFTFGSNLPRKNISERLS